MNFSANEQPLAFAHAEFASRMGRTPFHSGFCAENRAKTPRIRGGLYCNYTSKSPAAVENKLLQYRPACNSIWNRIRKKAAPDFALPLTDGSEAKLSELLQDHEDHPPGGILLYPFPH